MAQPQPQNLPRQGVAPTNTISSSREVVSVACKMPNGLILRSFVPHQETELVLGGGTRDVTVYRQSEDQVVIGGTAARIGDPRPPILVEGGYRVTPNVPKRLWDAWYEANKASDLVRNRLIYASERREDAEAFSREHEKVDTGLEGIDPSNPGKRVRGIVPGDKPK
jgi:hypothetical protein